MIASKYRKLWQLTEEHIELSRVPFPQLLEGLATNDPNIEPFVCAAAVRSASGSFKRKTVQTYDGFHCRHWGMLQDGSLGRVAKFMTLCLALGSMPSQLLTTVGKY